jgi:ribosomal-protein-alanine N-acetyltransferase
MNQQLCEISTMVMDDIEEILSIEESIFSAPWSRDVFIRELKLPISRSFVANTCKHQRSEIAGYIVFWIIAEEVQLHKIAVRENFRRTGIATKLMEAMMRNSCRDNVSICTLEVGRSNEGAKKLYEKFGFIVIDTRPRYYPESGDDAFIMQADMRKCLQNLQKEKI